MPQVEYSYQFSIIIPYYNDEDGMFACLAGVYRQQAPGCSFEVIVVDDCSDIDIAKRIRDQYPEVVLHRLKRNRGPGAARNSGIALARGEYIAFIDSDAVPNSLWLVSLVEGFAKGEKIICGPVRHNPDFLARLTALTSFGEYQNNQDGYRKHCPSVNYAIAADALTSFAYDETIPFAGEDMILSTRFTMAGLRIRYLAAAWVSHQPCLSVGRYCRRAYAYCLGFKHSRARCASLSGYMLHKYLRPGSAIVLFFIRASLDLVRLVKLRKELTVSLLKFPMLTGGIIFTRIIYAAGVFMGYLGRNER